MLFANIGAGPLPTGGSDPVMARSCSSTSQRSYPTRSAVHDLVDAGVSRPQRLEQAGLDRLHE